MKNKDHCIIRGAILQINIQPIIVDQITLSAFCFIGQLFVSTGFCRGQSCVSGGTELCHTGMQNKNSYHLHRWNNQVNCPIKT